MAFQQLFVLSNHWQLIERDLLAIFKTGGISILVSVLTYLLSTLSPADFGSFGNAQAAVFILMTFVLSSLLQWAKKTPYTVPVDPKQFVQIDLSSPSDPEVDAHTIG